jgi:ribonuclease Y
MQINIILISLLFLIIGVAIGFLVMAGRVKAEQKQRHSKGDEIISKAKEKAKEIRYQAKGEAKSVIKEEKAILEKEYQDKLKEVANAEKNLSKKEVQLERKLEDLEKTESDYKDKAQEIESDRNELKKDKEKYLNATTEYTLKLENVSGMSKENIKKELVDLYEEEAKLDAARSIKQIEEQAKEEAEKKSKKILSTAIQRFAGEYVAEQTISSVEIPSDEIKGRLIGREGRNIRAFEQICGVDLIIDDTPGLVVISCFNVVRKEIARMTIERLVADGRIHPAKIEEFHEKSKVQLDSTMRDLGEKAQMEIGVHGMHPEVLKMIGALNWRTSYMQNQYQHSLEVAFLCGAMAAELGMNVKQARRAGLLHDVGKVMDASMEGSHAVVGADFIKKYGEHADIVHAVRAHHEDVRPESILSHLVMAADALSGARPGIRKFLKESYVSRVTDIEKIADSFQGVKKSYAISAGREVRVLVQNDRVSDEQTVILSRDIAKRIEEEMSYPGSIKVSVIRETKSVGIAK